MDIHMQLLKKGVKAKKKRLGGGGQVSPTQDFKLAINNNISQLNNTTGSAVISHTIINFSDPELVINGTFG